MNSFRTLLVDDDVEAASRLAATLGARLGPTIVVPDAYQALSSHAQRPFDLIIAEIALPGASGIDLLERLAPAAPAVILTWLVSPAMVTRARHAGAQAVLSKPCSIPDLVAAARAAARPPLRPEFARV